MQEGIYFEVENTLSYTPASIQCSGKAIFPRKPRTKKAFALRPVGKRNETPRPQKGRSYGNERSLKIIKSMADYDSKEFTSGKWDKSELYEKRVKCAKIVSETNPETSSFKKEDGSPPMQDVCKVLFEGYEEPAEVIF